MITFDELQDSVGKNFLFGGEEVTLIQVHKWTGNVEYSWNGKIVTETIDNFLYLLEWV